MTVFLLEKFLSVPNTYVHNTENYLFIIWWHDENFCTHQQIMHNKLYSEHVKRADPHALVHV